MNCACPSNPYPVLCTALKARYSKYAMVAYYSICDDILMDD